MISVLNFKPFGKGSIKGFFDLRYHGLTIKGCRLMNGNGDLWFSFPQVKGEADGETKWFDQMYLTSLPRDISRVQSRRPPPLPGHSRPIRRRGAKVSLSITPVGHRMIFHFNHKKTKGA